MVYVATWMLQIWDGMVDAGNMEEGPLSYCTLFYFIFVKNL
jgi:hypothetical protein